MKRRRKGRWTWDDHVEIDEHVKKLLLDGVKKAGSQRELARTLGYSVPSNIVYQFLTAPKYKRYMAAHRFKKLRKFLERT